MSLFEGEYDNSFNKAFDYNSEGINKSFNSGTHEVRIVRFYDPFGTSSSQSDLWWHSVCHKPNQFQQIDLKRTWSDLHSIPIHSLSSQREMCGENYESLHLLVEKVVNL